MKTYQLRMLACIFLLANVACEAADQTEDRDDAAQVLLERAQAALVATGDEEIALSRFVMDVSTDLDQLSTLLLLAGTDTSEGQHLQESLFQIVDRKVSRARYLLWQTDNIKIISRVCADHERAASRIYEVTNSCRDRRVYCDNALELTILCDGFVD